MTAPTITRTGQTSDDTRSRRAGAGTNSQQAAALAMTDPRTLAGASNLTDLLSFDALGRDVGGATIPPAAIAPTPPMNRSPLADPFLALLADALDDLERTRIANENRYRALTRSTEDSDGEIRGFGLDDSHPAVARLGGIVEALAKMEHDATLSLQRAVRAHPLGPWIKTQKGIGDKQSGRLLAAIGDPYWNALHDRPRTVSELWAYCGLHVLPASQALDDSHRDRAGGAQLSDPDQSPGDTHFSAVGVAAKRRKGQKANWSNNAKMRAYLVAVSCMKSPGSPYRDVYLDRRLHTKTTHPEWTDGHSHNDALRIASKRILRDLWREARTIHEEAAS